MKIKILLFTVVILGVIGLGLYSFLSQENFRIVTIDINPSAQLVLNKDDKVVDVISLNEEADIVLAGLELENLIVAEAIDKFIDSATLTGYIDEYSEENVVLVTAKAETEEERENLEKRILDNINERVNEVGLSMLVLTRGVTEDIVAGAEVYGINNGKMLLIERAISLNDSLIKEELVEMSIREIQSEIKTVRDQRIETIKQNVEDTVQYFNAQRETKIAENEERINRIVEEIVERTGREAITEEEKEQLLNERKQEARTNLDQVREQIRVEMPEVIDERVDQNFNIPVDVDQYRQIRDSVRPNNEIRSNR